MRRWTTHCLIPLLIAATNTALAQDTTRYISPPSLPPTKGYSQVVEVPAGARLVYISGQVSMDRDGKLVGVGDSAARQNRSSRISKWPSRKPAPPLPM
jgi:hypothetical protein